MMIDQAACYISARHRDSLQGIGVLLFALLLSSCSMLPKINIGEGGAKQQGRTQLAESAPIRSILKQALSAWEAGDTAQAGQLFESMPLTDIRNAATLNHYAIFLREQWRIAEAKAIYLQALKIAPNDPLTHYNLAILYELYLGDLPQALAHFNIYQRTSETENKQVDGWIADLQRRIASSDNG